MSRAWTVPDARLRLLNDRPMQPDRSYVLYWMIAARRCRWNFALQHAVELAAELGLPLVILEALRCDYPRASDRLHRFVLDGMACNCKRLADRRALHYAYVEPRSGAGRGLLGALASRAAAIVTDDFPCFFLPRMVDAASNRVEARMVAVDGNGLLPMRSTERLFKTAHSFRRHLQKVLPALLDDPAATPLADPFDAAEPPAAPDDLLRDEMRRWPPAEPRFFERDGGGLRHLPLDHEVGEVDTVGGSAAGESTLAAFVDHRLDGYDEARNHPDEDASSGLSPYLHFGHLSAHQVLRRVIERQDWSLEKLSERTDGRRSGWWGMSESAEGFLDQLVTWRELGFNCCALSDDYDRYESLPDWARETLAAHAGDARPETYEIDQLAAAATDDEVWNAAQRQLLSEGRIHNYLRMLWGKRILEWSPTPQLAARTMIELNDRYALDGRDPNSYSGIFWVLGRYDRPWGPERPIFGKVRYMSSANTQRKLRVRQYLRRYGPAEGNGRSG